MAAEEPGALSIPGPVAITAGAGNPSIESPELDVLVPRAVRRCSAMRTDGRPCGATPGLEAPFCFVHDPAKREVAADARRLGGLRRRRDKSLKQVYAVSGLATIEEMRRYLEVTVADTLALENSVPWNRVLIAAVMAAVQLLEHGELAAEVRAIRAELDRRAAEAASDPDGRA